MTLRFKSLVHLMRRTTPPVAGAVGGAFRSAGPMHAGSGGRLLLLGLCGEEDATGSASSPEAAVDGGV